MAKRRANPRRRDCVACGVCVLQCPNGAIHVHRGCYAVVDEQLCMGCGLCGQACPADAIDLMDVKQEGNNGNN
ncbi:4Fe-4S binding domain-containing protein [Lachnospiraceae bacterium XBD2001]|nr:4Fe-4S binding domain-containing protein [Lachnospiraceae bacterium XBD2001]